MSLFIDESRPSSYQHQIALEHRARRSRIAARAVEDLGINLRRQKAVLPPVVEITASVRLYSKIPMFWELPPICEMSLPTLEKNGDVKYPSPPPDKIYKMREIQDAICLAFDVRRNDLLSARRTQNLIIPRQIAVALCKAFTLNSLPEIGRHFGGRDHATIFHSIKKMKAVVAEIEWSFTKRPLVDVAQLAKISCDRIFPVGVYARKQSHIGC